MKQFLWMTPRIPFSVILLKEDKPLTDSCLTVSWLHFVREDQIQGTFQESRTSRLAPRRVGGELHFLPHRTS